VLPWDDVNVPLGQELQGVYPVDEYDPAPHGVDNVVVPGGSEEFGLPLPELFTHIIIK
jgi:hypothetical protein